MHEGSHKEVVAVATATIRMVLRNRPDIVATIVKSQVWDQFIHGLTYQVDDMDLDESWHSWGIKTVYIQSQCAEFLHLWQEKRDPVERGPH